MDKDRVISLFGNEDFSPSALAFTVHATEAVDASWILDVFETACALFRTHGDFREYLIKTRNLAAFRQALMNDGKGLHYTDAIFRNIYRLMFESDVWDEYILTPAFIEGLAGLVEKYKKKSGAEMAELRSAGQFTRISTEARRLIDLLEILEEFKGKLAEKTLLASGR